MSKKILMVLSGAVLALALAASAQAQTCGPLHDCELYTTCTECEVSETATFTVSCLQDLFNPEEEECTFRSCCEEFVVFPTTVYYTGTDDGDPIGCIPASNPLVYTYQYGDVGEHTRKACLNSTCTFQCTNTVEVTVE